MLLDGKGKEITLSYYVGDVDDNVEIGLYHWANDDNSITSSTATSASWNVWNAGDTYLMQADDTYSGWYSVDIAITDTSADGNKTGLAIYKSTHTDDKDTVFKCDAWDNATIYAEILALESGSICIKDGTIYSSIEEAAEGTGDEETGVNIYYYIEDADAVGGFYYWENTEGTITVNGADTETWPLTSSWSHEVSLLKVSEYSGWHSINVTNTDTISNNESTAGFTIYEKSGSTIVKGLECSGWPEFAEIYAAILAKQNGESIFIRDGVAYDSREDAEAVDAVTLEELQKLVNKAKTYKEEDYKAAGWQEFQTAISAAETVIANESRTDDEIKEAYNNLKEAMDVLIPASIASAEINVKPVALADEFILGADISSYYSLKESGTKFYDDKGKELDDQGFFDYLKAGGTNWIRIRVWNDPYDSNGKGYGGGNNDLAKAKAMGKLATNAGMRVLIDFHYSDFWADPGKQKVPKAWKDKSVDDKADAVYQFTKSSLDDLKAAGVDVGMVQVGNETTNGICGVFYSTDGWAAAAKIYNAGSKAVRDFDADCLVAIHFTNPERSSNYANLAKNLNDNNVDYDVFASSYYPFWHGTTDNLTSVLANVAKTYNKKVMVAETSWATTLDDQDGHDNTVRKGTNDSVNTYAFSVQGQADEIRAVVDAANNVNSVAGAEGSSIGVFYWESAWISPYYVYDEDGTRNEDLYQKNKEAWEEYGSGWAASYGGDYDPGDAGKWYGGSAVDNQAWFDFHGNALPTAKVYSYIRTGAETDLAVSSVDNPSVTVELEGTVEYPDTVTVTFNNGTTQKYAVVWDETDQEKVDTSVAGTYEVKGTVTITYTNSSGEQENVRQVTLTVTVKQLTGTNLLANAGFEDDGDSISHTGWEVTGEGVTNKLKDWKENPHNGTYAMHFYSGAAYDFTATQKVESLEAGTYTFGGYIQGGDAADGDLQYAIATVYDKEGNKVQEYKSEPCALDGWREWKNPEIMNIDVPEGGAVEVGMQVTSSAGGMWGTLDDLYLFGTYSVTVDDSIKTSIGTLTVNKTKAVAGQTITVKAKSNTGYYLTTLTLSGKSIDAETLTSKNGKVSYDSAANTATITYSEKCTDEMTESFTMPSGNVFISAAFESTGEPADKTELDKLIADYDKIERGDYTAESWQTFTNALAAAKAVAENADATQEDINEAKAALEEAYKGLTTGSAGDTADLTALNALIAEYEKVANDGYTAESWKTFTDALAAAKTAAAKENVTQAEVDSAKAALETAYKGLTKIGQEPEPVREGLWAEWTPEWAEMLGDDNTITYTGKAIKPAVKVYDGENLLTTRSYSVSYKNNTKVGEASVIIKGKGNYTGSYTMTFKIDYVNLGTDDNVSIADLYAAASKNGNRVSVKPVVTWNGKKVNAKLYEVLLADTSEGAYVAPGTYVVEVKAKDGNGIYTGSRTIKITLADTNNSTAPQVLMSGVKIKFNFKSKQWKEVGITLAPEDITVTYKNEKLKLYEGEDESKAEDGDYKLTYENNDRIGTATVIVTGTGTPDNGKRFVGQQRKTFKITGTAIKAKDVKLVEEPFVYDGTAHEPKVTIEGLTEDNDFTVVYQNNTNAGKKATAVVTGINAYSGTVKKTFTIGAHDMNQTDVKVVFDESVPYEKGGSKSAVKEVSCDGRLLVLGTDYTVSYAKNTKVTEGATAEARIKGKGNYKMTKTITFAIVKQELGNLTAAAADQTSANKWNKVNPVITDQNGKTLKKGTDYGKTFTYTLFDADDKPITDTTATPPAAGMKVEVTATATETGNYKGTISASFRIIDAKKSIAKARITVTPQIYTGDEIELSKNDIALELKEDGVWKPLDASQYEIVGYANNINKGKKAKVTIHGVYPYGGTKTFNFEIKAQSIESMDWAGRIATMFEWIFN